MTSMPCRINSRLMVLMAASWPSQIGTAVRVRIRALFFISPNHRNVGCVCAADVERQVTIRPGNLAFPRALGEMQIGLGDLADAGGSRCMPVADEAATGIDERRAAVLEPLRALPGWREAEQFVGDDFRNGKAIVNVGTVDIA